MQNTFSWEQALISNITNHVSRAIPPSSTATPSVFITVWSTPAPPTTPRPDMTVAQSSPAPLLNPSTPPPHTPVSLVHFSRYLIKLDWTSNSNRQKINLPTNQEGCDKSETMDEKLSARRIQICRIYFCLGIILKVILNNFQNNA